MVCSAGNAWLTPSLVAGQGNERRNNGAENHGVADPRRRFGLGGCVAGMVASAAGTASRRRGQPQSNEHLQPAARQGVHGVRRAYGAVHIIDVVKARSTGSSLGHVDDGRRKQSFECASRPP